MKYTSDSYESMTWQINAFCTSCLTEVTAADSIIDVYSWWDSKSKTCINLYKYLKNKIYVNTEKNNW